MKRENKRRRVLAAFSLLLAWSLTPHSGAAEPLVIAASPFFY